jgi:hypothetical protein
MQSRRYITRTLEGSTSRTARPLKILSPHHWEINGAARMRVHLLSLDIDQEAWTTQNDNNYSPAFSQPHANQKVVNTGSQLHGFPDSELAGASARPWPTAEVLSSYIAHTPRYPSSAASLGIRGFLHMAICGGFLGIASSRADWSTRKLPEPGRHARTGHLRNGTP